MQVCALSLVDFRSYARAEVDFAAGLTAVVGPNGYGKTNLLEAIGFAAGLGSLRGAPEAALIRDGAEAAVVRCFARAGDGRELLIEAELARSRPQPGEGESSTDCPPARSGRRAHGNGILARRS